MVEVNSFFAALSGENNLLVTLIFFTVVIVIYSVFIYYFYIFLSKKNLIELNLNQYNSYEHPALVKFFAIIFYITEYIVILPIITFFWFAVLSILILLLAEGIEVSTVLLISAALVASVRVTSYISKPLSQELSKVLPFTLLAIAVTKPGFFDIGALLERVSVIPSLLSNILIYLFFIIAVELIMRVTDIIRGAAEVKKEVIEEEYSS